MTFGSGKNIERSIFIIINRYRTAYERKIWKVAFSISCVPPWFYISWDEDDMREAQHTTAQGRLHYGNQTYEQFLGALKDVTSKIGWFLAILRITWQICDLIVTLEPGISKSSSFRKWPIRAATTSLYQDNGDTITRIEGPTHPTKAKVLEGVPFVLESPKNPYRYFGD